MLPLPEDELERVVSAVGDRWQRLAGARILIAGATGFFGRWMLESALAADRRFRLSLSIIALARDPSRLPDLRGVEIISGDIRSFRDPGGLTHVAHLASTSGRQEESAELASAIVEGTRHLIEVAGSARLLLASSGAIYGRIPPHLAHAPEELAPLPDSDPARASYGEAKRTAERLCLDAARAQPLIARGFAFVGPLLPTDANFAIGNFLRDAAAGRTIEVRGDGTALRSWLYTSDLATWLWTILLAGAPGGIWNVGSERELSIAEAAARIAARFGVGCTIAKVPVPGAVAERYVPSTARARTELGLAERVDFDEAITRTERWLRLAMQTGGS